MLFSNFLTGRVAGRTRVKHWYYRNKKSSNNQGYSAMIIIRTDMRSKAMSYKKRSKHHPVPTKGPKNEKQSVFLTEIRLTTTR